MAEKKDLATMLMGHHEVYFEGSGREPQCEPNPDFPRGCHVHCVTQAQRQLGVPTCTVALPWPAPQCGVFFVSCRRCPMTVALTAAGRPDDPKSIEMPCRRQEEN